MIIEGLCKTVRGSPSSDPTVRSETYRPFGGSDRPRNNGRVEPWERQDKRYPRPYVPEPKVVATARLLASRGVSLIERRFRIQVTMKERSVIDDGVRDTEWNCARSSGRSLTDAGGWRHATGFAMAGRSPISSPPRTTVEHHRSPRLVPSLRGTGVRPGQGVRASPPCWARAWRGIIEKPAGTPDATRRSPPAALGLLGLAGSHDGRRDRSGRRTRRRSRGAPASHRPRPAVRDRRSAPAGRPGGRRAAGGRQERSATRRSPCACAFAAAGPSRPARPRQPRRARPFLSWLSRATTVYGYLTDRHAYAAPDRPARLLAGPQSLAPRHGARRVVRRRGARPVAGAHGPTDDDGPESV